MSLTFINYRVYQQNNTYSIRFIIFRMAYIRSINCRINTLYQIVFFLICQIFYCLSHSKFYTTYYSSKNIKLDYYDSLNLFIVT